MQAKIVKIYRRLYGGGGASLCPPPIQASAKFHDFEELYLC